MTLYICSVNYKCIRFLTMSSVAPIALLTPIVASNAVFSVRRASKGVDAISENPLYAAANIDIAAGQVVKGTRAASQIASTSSSSVATSFKAATTSAADAIKAASNASKVVSGIGKVVQFTADHINPVICVGSAIKVAGDDDKVDEAARETLRLGSMFLFEKGAKNFIGMPVTKNFEGMNFTVKTEGLYKQVFSDKQISAIKDFCKTKECLKYVPSMAKGLLFVGASIAGYKFGNLLANEILGKDEVSHKTC